MMKIPPVMLKLHTMTAPAATRLDNAANPVLVKEVRQSMPDLAVGVPVMAAALLALAATAISAADSGAGLHGILSVALSVTMSLAALAAGARFAAERCGGDDLLFLTTLSPWRIVLGKFAAVSAVCTLLWFMFLPFFVAAWALRGVNPVQLANAMLLPLLWIAPFTGFILILAAFKTRSSGGRMLLPTAMLAAAVLLQIKFMPEAATPKAWFSLAAAAASLTAVELALAQAAISHPAGNRMPWPRFWGLFSVAALAAIAPRTTAAVPAAAAVIAMMMALVGCCEPLEPPRRALVATPHGAFRRIFHFLFASGAASGWVYSLLLAALVWLAGNPDHVWSMRYTGMFFYAILYLTLCWNIRRSLTGNRLFDRHPSLTPVLVLGTLIAASAAAMQIFSGDPGIWLFFSPLELAYGHECVRIGFISSLALMAALALYSLPVTVATMLKFGKRNPAPEESGTGSDEP